MKKLLLSACIAIGLSIPVLARAEMPQTDVELLAQSTAKSPDLQLTILEMFYDLHVSELQVQLKSELRTTAFFGVQRAKKNGDASAIAKAETKYKETNIVLRAEKKLNQNLRLKLFDISGVDFADSLGFSLDAPEMKLTHTQGVSADLIKARNSAWASVEATKRVWREMRFELLELQERYNNGEKVSLGKAMRLMTKAEINLTKAAGDYRLVESKIASKLGRKMTETLAKF